MDKLSRLRALGALIATTTLLAACGGGGSDAPPPPPPPPPPPASNIISGKAVDGALQGARACYDLNDNGVCDSGTDPASAATDTGGEESDAPLVEEGIEPPATSGSTPPNYDYLNAD